MKNVARVVGATSSEGLDRLFIGGRVQPQICVLNILDSLRANQIPAKGVVTIVCRIEIRKMAEC